MAEPRIVDEIHGSAGEVHGRKRHCGPEGQSSQELALQKV